MLALLCKTRTMKCLLNQLSLLHPPNFPNYLKSTHILNPPSLRSGFWGSNSKINFQKSGFCSETKAMASAAKIVQDPESISYLSQQEAAEVDEILMGPLGFSVDQLMELAGLSVATSIAECKRDHVKFFALSFILSVASRKGNGFPTVQSVCESLRILFFFLLFFWSLQLILIFTTTSVLPRITHPTEAFWSVHFLGRTGTPRPPFDDMIQRLVALGNPNQKHQKSPVIVSVDIPSGWHVEEGDLSGEGIKPDMLVSLTAPKLCAKKFSGPHHFLGGRFVPPPIADKFKLNLPAYPGTSMCVRIGKPPQVDISALRENYISPEFSEDQAQTDPFDQFQKWFDDAVAAGLKEPNAMALSTTGKDGKPSSRMVLLKGVDKDGFVWYTNYESQKAQQISENPSAALLFYWDGLNRQVRVEGPVQKVSEEESEKYFHSRPRGSQIGAIVSKQSTVIPGRQFLHQQQEELEAKYSDGNTIPKPKYWGGYRLKPELFEFWQGQPSRLHDRLLYSPIETDGTRAWKIERLSP
ncbi:pyridoxine/pyridoxamine 5'-phosphate oxidase 1, chloroplastic-like [Olea europaea var. sylvestris]|uniref:pyridoxine/pyridoxamine 5'-phosphate oxidase 1, chloroplastic-like n=1 Tax=Olea europaea var. sylvestris TaxID=158386 RepID=UPI000C1D6534|nr:pyridoxine/pyridoxamine 5'-phosphate oxidase 1, chloroplastic-like [Olea europaea var. sylvestris]